MHASILICINIYYLRIRLFACISKKINSSSPRSRYSRLEEVMRFFSSLHSTYEHEHIIIAKCITQIHILGRKFPFLICILMPRAGNVMDGKKPVAEKSLTQIDRELDGWIVTLTRTIYFALQVVFACRYIVHLSMSESRSMRDDVKIS